MCGNLIHGKTTLPHVCKKESILYNFEHIHFVLKVIEVGSVIYNSKISAFS